MISESKTDAADNVAHTKVDELAATLEGCIWLCKQEEFRTQKRALLTLITRKKDELGKALLDEHGGDKDAVFKDTRHDELFDDAEQLLFRPETRSDGFPGCRKMIATDSSTGGNTFTPRRYSY